MDAMEFFIVGAQLVQVGTSNFIDPNAANDYKDELVGLLEKKKISKFTDVVGTLNIEEVTKALGW